MASGWVGLEAQGVGFRARVSRTLTKNKKTTSPLDILTQNHKFKTNPPPPRLGYPNPLSPKA